jgi:Rrf2 family protein
MRIHAKTDYAIRSLLFLADRQPDLVKLDLLIAEQAMPRAFVEMILSELRRAGLVLSRRGSDGGFTLAVPATQITIGDVIRVVDGPLTELPALPAAAGATGSVAQFLPDVWLAMTVSLTRVLDGTTLHDVLTGELPEHVQALIASAGPAATGAQAAVRSRDGRGRLLPGSVLGG